MLYLALHQIGKKWTMPIRDWQQAMSLFMSLFGERYNSQPQTQKNLQSHIPQATNRVRVTLMLYLLLSSSIQSPSDFFVAPSRLSPLH